MGEPDGLVQHTAKLIDMITLDLIYSLPGPSITFFPPRFILGYEDLFGSFVITLIIGNCGQVIHQCNGSIVKDNKLFAT